MEQGWQKYQMKKGQKDVSFGGKAFALTDEKIKYPLEKNFFHVFVKNPTWKTEWKIIENQDMSQVQFTEPTFSGEDYFYFRILDIEGHTHFIEIHI